MRCEMEFAYRETTITWTPEGHLLITDRAGRIVHRSPSWQFTAEKLATMYENGTDVRYATGLENIVRQAVQNPKTTQQANLIINEFVARLGRLIDQAGPGISTRPPGRS